MRLNLKRKQFAMYGGNNNFTSVNYPSGSIQANPAATTMTSTGRSYTAPRPLNSYANTNPSKGMFPPVKKQSFRSNLDPTLPPSKWAGRIIPYNRDRFTPNPNIGTVKNSPLRPLNPKSLASSAIGGSSYKGMLRPSGINPEAAKKVPHFPSKLASHLEKINASVAASHTQKIDDLLKTTTGKGTAPSNPRGYSSFKKNIPLWDGKTLTVASVPGPGRLEPLEYAPSLSRGERAVNMVKGIGRGIAGLFTGKK